MDQYRFNALMQAILQIGVVTGLAGGAVCAKLGWKWASYLCVAFGFVALIRWAIYGLKAFG